MPKMLRSWPQWFVLAVPAALVTLATLPLAQAQLGGASPVIALSPKTAAEADPIPLRRVVVPPERVLTELERARQGVLVQLPRAEFEQRVRQAARTEEALKKPPRLLQARYQATLSEIALAGTSQWTILNPTDMPGIFPMQPFNLALRTATLDKTRAILGDLDGKTQGLLVERSGKHLATMEWSARGDPGPAGVRFKLEVPACALTSFELELPVDRELVVTQDRSGCLLSGPFPGSMADRRLWRLSATGTSTLDLVVRQAAGPGQQQPLLLATLATTQKLAPEQLTADFDLNLEVLHGRARELALECDPGLRPTSISVGSLEIDTWEFRPGGAGEKSLLRVQLPESSQGKASPLRVHIHCLAPVLVNQPWTSPGVRITGAVPRGESLVLEIPPEIQLDRWQAGNFDLVAAATRGAGTQILTLQSGIRDPGAVHRPRAVLTLHKREVQVRGVTWWQLRPDGAALTTQLLFDVERGHLFHIPVLIPPGWHVDRLDLRPAKLLRTYSVESGPNGQATLVLELQRPIDAPDSARLVLELRPEHPEKFMPGDSSTSETATTLAFPVVLPGDAPLSEGVFALSIDPALQAQVNASVAPSPVMSERERPGSAAGELSSFLAADTAPAFSFSPWGSQAPDYFYRYRGRQFSGTIELRPRRPLFHARCTSEVILAAGRAALHVRLHLDPEAGNVDIIDVKLSTPTRFPWPWKSLSKQNQVRSVQRLPVLDLSPAIQVLGAGSALAAASTLTVPAERGSLWRLTLAQPLREPLTLDATVDLGSDRQAARSLYSLTPLAAASPLHILTLLTSQLYGEADPGHYRWEVPLCTVVNAGRASGEIHLHLAGNDRVDVDATGLREIATEVRGQAPSVWRSFRYGPGHVALMLSGRTPSTESAVVAPVAERAHLITQVAADGRLLNYFRFRIQGWQQRALPVRLPPGAALLGALADGRWAAQPAQVQAPDGTVVVELPVAGGSSVHNFEIAYALSAPDCRLWAKVDAPAPRLPVDPAASRRTWWLPPGISPLDENRFQRLPGPDAGEGTGHDPDRLAQLIRSYLPLAQLRGEDWQLRQRQIVADVNTRLRNQRRERRDLLLGDVFYQMASECIKNHETLVVDSRALADAGLYADSNVNEERGRETTGSQITEPETLLSVPSLDELGVVAIAMRPAPLLTTRRELQSWRQASGEINAHSAPLEAAVAEAAKFGRDSSGRFYRTLDWLEQQQTTFASVPRPEDMSHLARADSWVAWEPLAGESAAETLTVIRPALLSGVSWVVAFLFLLGAWSVQRSRLRGRYALLLLWLAANGLAYLWSPESLRGLVWWPLLAGVLVAALWFIRAALSSRPRSGSSAPAAATTTFLVLFFSAALASQAAAPGPETVLLLPGPADAPSKETALVAPDLLKRLESLAHRGAAGLRGAFLSGARYEGAVLNGAAEITAEFHIHCFSDDATRLDLPLGGVELLEARLDDAPAYPTVLAAPRTGYALLVKGRGPHVARLRFSVPLAAGEEDRELRFTIPELVQSRLELTVPPGATYLQTLLGRGAQQVSANEKQTILTADLGRVPSVAAYWRQPKSPPSLPSVQVTEHYLWTLQGSMSRLQAVLQYAVTQGAATALALALPDNLEVRQVRVSSSAIGSLAAKLKQWTVAGVGNERRLHLEFQAPITNGVQVALELLSSVPPGPVVALALPRPLDAAPAAGDSYIGYRVQGWQAEPGQFNRITGIQQDEFNQLWELAEPEDRDIRADRAYSFRRTPEGDPSLQLQLRAPRNDLTCWQSLVWQVSEERVDLRGTARIARPPEGARQAGPTMPAADRKPFALVEWEVPAEITVTHIGGKDVRSWSRLGPRIQIWLQGGVTTTAVELAGWLPRPAGKRLEPFHLPHLFVTGADPHWTLLRITPGTGLTLRPDGLQHLWPVPALGRYSRQQVYLSRHAAYDGIFHVSAGLPVADVRMLTVGELVNHALSFSSTIDHHIRRGELDSLTLRLRNGEGAEVRFEAAHLAGQREHRTDAVHRSWTLDLNPGATGRYRVQLVGRLPLESRADPPFPAVSIEGSPAAEHLLVLLGSNLEALEPRGLSPITNPLPSLQAWPTVADRLKREGGSVWKITASDWQLRVRLRPASLGSNPVRLFLEEQAAALRNGRKWEHQGAYWLYHDAGADLNIALPAGARLTRVRLDGADIAPLEVDAQHVWLPLTGGSGLRILQLAWQFDANREDLLQPELAKPQLQDVPYVDAAAGTGRVAGAGRSPNQIRQKANPPESLAITGWTILIPPGYRVQTSKDDAAADSSAGQDLRRATALLRLSEELARDREVRAEAPQAQQLATVQQQFYAYCQFAQMRLAARDRAGDTVALAAWLDRLQQLNEQVAASHHFEAVRAQAEERAKASPLVTRSSIAFNSGCYRAEAGLPSYWQASAGSPAPRVHLAAAEEDKARQRFGLSGLLLLLCLIAWFLAYFPRVVAVLRAFWPEQLLVLGCLGWQLVSPNAGFALLVLVGIGGRIYLAVRWLVAFLQQRSTAATA